jgi:hypothetical protein
MSSQIRTALVGVGVIAICIAMASLKGHHLLMAFAGASLLAGIWSWLQHTVKPVRRQPPAGNPPVPFGRTSGSNCAENVYPFPSQGWNVPDASSS